MYKTKNCNYRPSRKLLEIEICTQKIESRLTNQMQLACVFNPPTQQI